MIKVNPNNGKEIKAHIFPGNIFNSDGTSFFKKKYQGIPITFKSEISIAIKTVL